MERIGSKSVFAEAIVLVASRHTESCLVKFEPVLGNSVLFALYPLAGFGRSTKAGKRISVASGANNRRETGG